MPNADAGLTRPATGQNADSGVTFSRYFDISTFIVHMICQHHKTSLTPSAAVYRRAGCTPFLLCTVFENVEMSDCPISPVTE
jgi:hypothetical protein